MPAPIVIDIGVAEPQRELAAALVDACTQAASSTECHLVRDAPSGPYVAIAIVTWEEGDRARVEVGLRRDPVSEWRTRELTFQAADADVERYRSVGFVIGSLATAAHDDSATPTQPSAPPPTPPPPPPPIPVIEPPPPSRPPRPAPSRGWVGLYGTAGGGLDHGAPRFGGRLSAGIRIIPLLSAVASAGASTRVRDSLGVVPQWLDAGCGLSFAIWPPTSHHLELRAEVIAEQFSAKAQQGGRSDSNLQTRAAARVGADGVFVVAAPLSIVAGVEGTFRSATVVNVGYEHDGATRYVEFGAVVGIRFDL